MLETYQKDNKLFEFSRNTNRKELKIRKHDVTCNDLVALISLQLFRCKGFAEMVFASLNVYKVPSFLTRYSIGKYQPLVKDF